MSSCGARSPTREAIRCEGTPFWTGTLPVTGDGTYTTPPVTLAAAGYYTYRESIAATEAHEAVITACGEVSETTVAKAAPKVTTVASNAVVKPDDEIFDRLTVSGLGATPATIEVALYGPYASRADIDCEGAPYWKGEVEATGDGTFNSPKATVRRAGFYAFRERIVGTETVAGVPGRVRDRGRDVARRAADPGRAGRRRAARRGGAGRRRAEARPARAARRQRAGLGRRHRHEVRRARHPDGHPPGRLVARRRRARRRPRARS